MNDNKVEIGTRLKEFAQKNFSSLAEFSRRMGKDTTYFTAYFRGDNVLGGELLSKLAKLGCDINWLLCGATSSVGNNIHEPTESYNMSYSELVMENKNMREEINQFKIMIFDLERETKKQQLRITELEEANKTFQKELEDCLEKGSSKQTN